MRDVRGFLMLGMSYAALLATQSSPPPDPGGVIGSLPALPSTPDRVVTNRAELVQAIADIGTTLPVGANIAVDAVVLDLGQSNINTGGFTDQTVLINKSCTIYPLAGYGAFEANPYGDNRQYAWRFTRTCTIKGFLSIDGAVTVNLRGFAHTVDVFPAASSKTVKVPWESVGILTSSRFVAIGGACNVDIQGYEPYFGKDATHTPFDPSEKLPDFRSPAQWEYTAGFEGIVEAGDPLGLDTVFTGHGDLDWNYYNRYNGMPIGFSMTGGQPWTGASFVCKNNYVHDLQTGVAINARANGVQTIEIDHCDFARQFRDHIIETMTYQSKYLSKTGRLLIGSILSDALDSMNPHSDAIQLYMYNGTQGIFVPIAHLRKHAILGHRRNTDRSSLQFMFLQTSAAHYSGVGNAINKAYLLGAELSDLISLGSNKLFTSDGQRDTKLSGCVAFTADADPIAGPASVLFQRGISGRIGLNDIPDSMSVIENSLFENFSTPSISASRKIVNSAAFGQKGNRNQPLSTFFTQAAGSQATINDMFNLFVRTAGHATKGPQFTTLADYLNSPYPDLFEVQFIDKLETELNTVTMSNRAYVHGTLGVVRNLVLPAGVEARSLDPYTEAEIATWTAGPLAIQSGQLAELRATSANAAVTVSTFNGNLSGKPWQWNIQTKSVTPFQRSQFAAARISKATNGLTGAANSRRFSFALDWVHDSTTLQRVLYPGTSLHWSFGLSTTVDFLIRNGAGVTIARIQTGANTLVAGNAYKLLLSVDLDAEGGTYDDCVKIMLNGVIPSKGASVAVTPAQPHFFFEQAEIWHAFATNTGTAPFLGELGMMALWDGVAIDWYDAANRVKFSSELFGDGSGLTGSIPRLMFNGNAATLNGANAANLGSGGAFDNLGTDVTQL